MPGWLGNRDALKDNSTDPLEAWRELVLTWDLQKWGENLPVGNVMERARQERVLPEEFTTFSEDMSRPFGKALVRLTGQVIGAYRLTARTRGGRKVYTVRAA